jgi:polyhydroxyalkanoate synthesis regulator phasin
MDVDDILNRYNLTRETARQYIDTIVRFNQSQAADEADVSRRTFNNYQRALREMTDTERAALVSALAHETLIEHITDR